MFSLRDCTYGSENALPWNFLNPWTVFLQFVTTCLMRERKETTLFNWRTNTNCANCQFMTWQIDLCWCSFCVESCSCSVHYVMKRPPPQSPEQNLYPASLSFSWKHTWLFAAAPIDRFRGPKETHALKTENTIHLSHLQQLLHNGAVSSPTGDIILTFSRVFFKILKSQFYGPLCGFSVDRER